MTPRPHPLTVYVSDEELAFLQAGAKRLNGILEKAEPPNFPAPLGMTPARLVSVLIDRAQADGE